MSASCKGGEVSSNHRNRLQYLLAAVQYVNERHGGGTAINGDAAQPSRAQQPLAQAGSSQSAPTQQIAEEWSTIAASALRQSRTASKKRTHTPKKFKRCLNCAVGKLRCSDTFPCRRCFHMCLPCRPQSSSHSEPYLDLAMMRQEPWMLRNTYASAFHRQYHRGTLDRRKIQAQLHAWRIMSHKLGMDITYGLFDEVCQASNISAVELESHDELLWDNRGRRSSSPPYDECAHRSSSARLQATQAFMALDGEHTMVTMGTVRPSGVVMAMNRTATRLFCSTDEFLGHMSRHHTLPVHVFAAMVDPQDRDTFYDMTIAAGLRPDPVPETAFIKLCERNGEIELYIIRSRFVYGGDVFSDALVTYLFAWERAPASKHVTRRPCSTRDRRIDRFRKGVVGPEHTQRQGECGSTDDIPRPLLPGLACVPLPGGVDVAVLADVQHARTHPFDNITHSVTHTASNTAPSPASHSLAPHS